MNKSGLKLILIYLTALFAGFGVFYNYYLYGFSNARYFTNQSNLLVFIVMMLIIIRKNHIKWFDTLASVAFISIIITGVIYNTLLRQFEIYMNDVEIMMMYINHTVNPILYGLFYLRFLKNPISYKKFYILLLHPLIYFLFYQITGLFTKYYPYPFMDPILIGYPQMLMTNLLILMPLLVLTVMGFIFIKEKIDDRMVKEV